MKKQIIWIGLMLTVLVAIFYVVKLAGSDPVPSATPEEVIANPYEEENTDGDKDPLVTDEPNDGCFIGGCSGQICSDEPNAASTCEYREAYACYRLAKCERQTTGKCGWTQSSELRMCLNEANN